MRVLKEAKKRLMAFGYTGAVAVASVLKEMSAEELLKLFVGKKLGELRVKKCPRRQTELEGRCYLVSELWVSM